MSDFFGALELELRAAAERPPRRTLRLGDALGALAAAALVAAAVFVAVAVLGGGEHPAPVSGASKPDPVGTVIPKGEGSPPRQRRSTVVATGTAPGIGPWQLEASRSVRLADPETDEVYQPAGLRCLTFYALDPPKVDPQEHQVLNASGQCGEFPRTPGFSRLQFGAKRVLVYGRVPKRASAVAILVPGRGSINARLHEGPKSARGDFYAVAVKPPLPRARVNWFDEKGRPGSRGIALMPPITRH
jgi:hypothetical protein